LSLSRRSGPGGHDGGLLPFMGKKGGNDRGGGQGSEDPKGP